VRVRPSNAAAQREARCPVMGISYRWLVPVCSLMLFASLLGPGWAISKMAVDVVSGHHHMW
jgi:hypothetical protein